MESLDISAEDLIDNEWEKFLTNNTILSTEVKDVVQDELNIPKATPIHISTKTMITYLNQEIDLNTIFWKIPIIKYHETKNGIIKKQIKITSFNQEEIDTVNELISHEDIYQQEQISFINNKKLKVPFKHVQKINIGTSKKELISYRKKSKGAFYNCFALILRILHEDVYKEVHVKVFNTGKLEIPGIQTNEMLYITLDILLDILRPFTCETISYNKENIETVLINSDFNCGFYINRNKLHNLLKVKYNMISMFDPCSYPGIQTKFYYNKMNAVQDGICRCTEKCAGNGCGDGNGKCIGVSFMIFRTGSILIVGHCDETLLHVIYDYLVNILKTEYSSINEGNRVKQEKKQVVKKVKRQHLIFDII